MALSTGAGSETDVEAVCDDQCKIFLVLTQGETADETEKESQKGQGMNNRIWFHADDFGVTREQSARILECYDNGVLNSISVLPNTGALKESLRLLDQADLTTAG